MNRFHTHSRALMPLLVVASLTMSCSGDDGPGEYRAFVVDDIRLVLTATEVDGEMQSVGFDLDGFEGPPPEGNACPSPNQFDFVTPDGRRGADNALAANVETLELIVGLGSGNSEELTVAPFENLIQEAVTGGTLLLLIEIDRIHSFENDDDVLVRLSFGKRFATGIGADGRLLAGQTFDVNPDVEPVEIETRIRNGELFFSGVQLPLVGSFSDVAVNVPMDRVGGRVQFNTNGTISGEVGGSIPLQEIADIIPLIGGFGIPDRVAANALRGFGDIMNFETGVCDSMSAALRMHGVPAFIFSEPDPATTLDAGMADDAGTP